MDNSLKPIQFSFTILVQNSLWRIIMFKWDIVYTISAYEIKYWWFQKGYNSSSCLFFLFLVSIMSQVLFLCTVSLCLQIPAWIPTFHFEICIFSNEIIDEFALLIYKYMSLVDGFYLIQHLSILNTILDGFILHNTAQFLFHLKPPRPMTLCSDRSRKQSSWYEVNMNGIQVAIG